ncbi:MAG: GDP-mannose 4,6-dehydratase [Pseudomonadota bacterium]
MITPSVFILGATGQDGYYLSTYLDELGHQVIPTDDSLKLNQSPNNIEQYFSQLIKEKKPTHIFNFAALATGMGMFDDPYNMMDVNGFAVIGILEAIRKHKPDTKFCQASSSEMFGMPNSSPQNEHTHFCPRTPYGAAKLLAHNMVGIYRKHYNLYACSAILFNHESSKRSDKFVTRKVTQAAARIKLGLDKHLMLNSLDSRRDWGYAPDFVRGMWQMLQQPFADDYVIATGITHSIADLCEIAFDHVDLNYKDYVLVDSALSNRAIEGMQLVGDASKARKELGWAPSINFKQMICEMVDSDITLLRTQRIV